MLKIRDPRRSQTAATAACRSEIELYVQSPLKKKLC
jgi:hypothetical protein